MRKLPDSAVRCRDLQLVAAIADRELLTASHGLLEDKRAAENRVRECLQMSLAARGLILR